MLNSSSQENQVIYKAEGKIGLARDRKANLKVINVSSEFGVQS